MRPPPPPIPATPHPEGGVGVGPRRGTAAVARWSGVRTPAVVAGSIALASLALHLRDPHTSGSWGECPWLAMTGLYCPGCGGLRAVNDLTRGDVLGAASSNLLFIASVPLLVWWWARWTRRSWRGETAPAALPRSVTRVAVPAAVVLAVAFTVLRNLAVGSWLAP